MQRSLQIVICFLLMTGGTCLGQDMHFSQFYEAPAMLNPALTGMSNSTRGSIQYKNQWRSVTVPYSTMSGSYEMRFNTSEWEKIPNRTKFYKLATRRVSGGLSFFSDRAGDGKMGLTQVQLSVSSAVPIGNYSMMIGGMSAAVCQRGIQYSSLVFPKQYNGSGYDPGLESGEQFTAGAIIYGDFAGGLAWAYRKPESAMRKNNQFLFNIGFSVFHFNQPHYSFIGDNSEILYSRKSLHGQLEAGFKNTNVSIVPAFSYALQGPSQEFLAGGLVKYRLKEDTKYTGYIKGSSISLGAYYRHRDAVIPNFLMEFGSLGIGFSYDLNISELSAASHLRGGFEVMIRYVTPSPFLYQSASRI